MRWLRSRPRRVTVWSRTGCHLCEEMVAQVRRLADERRVEVHLLVEDVDDARHDPALREELTSQVPVLEVDGERVGRWSVTDAQVLAALRARRR